MIKIARLTLLAMLAACATACSDVDEARMVLEYDGYTDIQITGFAPMGCPDSDDNATRFDATSPTGKRVTGIVCTNLAGRPAAIR